MSLQQEYGHGGKGHLKKRHRARERQLRPRLCLPKGVTKGKKGEAKTPRIAGTRDMGAAKAAQKAARVEAHPATPMVCITFTPEQIKDNPRIYVQQLDEEGLKCQSIA